MESETDIYTENRGAFLKKWTVEEIRRMTLDQYVSVGDKDTFSPMARTENKKAW